MPHTSRLIRLAAVLTLSAATAAFAQDAAPAAPPAAHHMHGPAPAPTNLQVLPKTMTGEQVHEVMHKFEADLGVECSFCHAKGVAGARPDFASDANPMKDRARIMIRMSMDINNPYLAMLTDPAPTTKVGCGTCHRGNSKPPAFEPAPEMHHMIAAPPPPPPPPQ